MASEGDDPLLATLRLVETLAGVGYWRYAPRTEAVTWSDQVYRIHGLVPGSVERSFALVVEAYHPDDRPILLQHVAKTLATGEGYNFKLRLRRPNDGQERTVRAIAEATVDAAGRTCEIFGVFQDITEEVEARARLEESETRYRLLADASIDIIIKLSPDGLIQYVSPAIRRYGYQPEDLIGKPGGLLVHPDDAERVRKVFLGLTSDNPPNPSRNRGFRFLTADGGHVWMEGNPAIVRGDDGSFRAIVSSLRDITDQRAAQVALTESEARYRFLAEHTHRTSSFERDRAALSLTHRPAAGCLVLNQVTRSAGQRLILCLSQTARLPEQRLSSCSPEVIPTLPSPANTEP